MTPDPITRAIRFAAEAHEGQRYGDQPYIFHPLRVMETLRAKGYAEHLVIAGVLHDVVEDTTMNLVDIEEAFGREVTEVVAGLTHLREVDYADYVREMPDVSLPVKWADTFDNYSGLGNLNDPVRRLKLTAKYLRNLATLSLRLDPEDMKLMTDYEFNTIALARAEYPEGWG